MKKILNLTGILFLILTSKMAFATAKICADTQHNSTVEVTQSESQLTIRFLNGIQLANSQGAIQIVAKSGTSIVLDRAYGAASPSLNYKGHANDRALLWITTDRKDMLLYSTDGDRHDSTASELRIYKCQ